MLQVLFEAVVSSERRGYLGLDDILLLNYPCCECRGMGPDGGMLLGWAAGLGAGVRGDGPGESGGPNAGVAPGVRMLPGLVELHLLGTSEVLFLHLHPYPHQLQYCFSFYKILGKHRLNTRPECPHQERLPRLVGTQNPDSPNTLALGITLYFF